MIAYFSMEIGLTAEMPTYAGGLGVLAGDTLRSAADLGIPLVGVTLLHRSGYFHQRLDQSGHQFETPSRWTVEDFVVALPPRVTVRVEGRPVQVQCWKCDITGAGSTVPVYFLDTDLPENSPYDRTLTHFLYGGDAHYRLCQEVVLGIGGIRMLRALGHTRARVDRYHLNEGHSSLLALELLDESVRARGGADATYDDVAAVRSACVFTTHTPVPAGHDQFAPDLAARVIGDSPVFALKNLCWHEGRLNLTHLALNFSRYVNGVAMQHGELSRRQFTGRTIDAITNGVHAATWTSDDFQALYDRYIPGWRRDNFSLRYALGIPDAEIWSAHAAAKSRLLDRVAAQSGARFDPAVFTIGFARRASAYKRADLLVQDVDRLRQIAAVAGALQVIYAGKAHPADDGGKAIIERVAVAIDRLSPLVRVVYLENYDIALGKLTTAGVDLWLNTPLPPLEASGTSGMKAALNGVPSASVLDGWWVEGHIEGVTGWAIGSREQPPAPEDRSIADASSLYEKLETVILPLFYHRRTGYIEVMRQAIALNGSFFNGHRMLQEYLWKAYAV